MKKPSDHLFRLIKTMSSAERRYFKQYHAQEQLIKLFDTIHKMDKYDEALLRMQIKEEALQKNLKVYKKRLFEQVLESLTQYQKEKNNNLQLLTQIGHIHTLLSKQLYDVALSAIEDCRTQCRLFEEYELELSVLSLLLRSTNRITLHDTTTQEIIAEMNQLNLEIKNYIYYQQVLRLFRNISPNYTGSVNLTVLKQKISMLLDEKIYQHPEIQPLTPKAKRIYHLLMYESSYYLEQYEQAYLHAAARVVLYEQADKLLDTRFDQYFSSLGNLQSACIRCRRFDELEALQTRIDAHILRYPDKEKLYIPYFANYLGACKHQKQWNKAVQFYVHTIQPFCTQHPDFAASDKFTRIFMMMVEVLLILRELKHAQKCLQMLDIAHKTLENRFFDLCLILEIIYYIEQSEFVFLENYAKKYLNHLKRDFARQPFLKLVLQFARKIASSGIADHKQLYQKHLQMVQIQLQQDGLSTLLLFFDYYGWLEARAQGIDWRTHIETRSVL